MYAITCTIHPADPDTIGATVVLSPPALRPTALRLIDRQQRDALADGHDVIRSGGGRLAVRETDGAVLTYTLTRAGR